MPENIRVVVLGAGHMGRSMIKLLQQKAGLALVGVYDHCAARVGLDVRVLLGHEAAVGVQISNDLSALIQQTAPHVALQATCSRVVEAAPDIVTLLRHRVHVISIAEEMVYPACQSPGLAAAMHQLAMAQHVTVVGTGINPGFVLDLLIIALTGVCWQIRTITARRINDLAPYGPTVLQSQGVGLTPEAFHTGLVDGTVVGHIGFPESMHLIAKALGWTLDRIEQHRTPILAQHQRDLPGLTIFPGHVAGCLHTAVAYRQEVPVLTFIHPQQVAPHLEDIATGDYIDIDGEPNIHLAIRPEIPGGLGTAGLAVNLIPLVLQTGPGLKSMLDLPVPAAYLGDIRRLRHRQG